MTNPSNRPLGTWADKAVCRGLDVNLFYARTGVVTQEAVNACANCPVRTPCSEHAINHEDFGYWAGMSQEDRIVERKRRQREGIPIAGIKVIAPCGTERAYHAHLKTWLTAPCPPCMEAHADYERRRRRRARR